MAQVKLPTGPKPPGLNLEVLRELTPEDLLGKPGGRVAPTEGLVRVRAVHHAQARLLAAGQKPAQVAAALGVSRLTLDSLQDDPTFMELVEYYRDQIDVIYLSTHEEASLLARMAMGELRERLETTPGKFSENQLRELAIAMLDRTDLPPKTGQAQPVTAPTITFNFGPLGVGQGGPGQVTLEGQTEQPLLTVENVE